MDWFTILLIVLFFVFPLIRQVLEQMSKKDPQNLPQPLPPQTEPREVAFPWENQSATPAQLPVETKVESAPGGWSDGWGNWPGQESEPVPVTLERVEQEERSSWDPTPTAPKPAAPIEAVPVRPRDEIALHTGLKALAAVRATSVPIVETRRVPIHSGLASRAALRQAIVLQEILGPPISLRGDRPSAG